MKKLTIYLGKKLLLNQGVYYILNFTWGLVTTLLGYILLLVLWPFGKIKTYRGVLYLEFRKNFHAAFSIGMVLFIPPNFSDNLIKHEYGHTVQNAIFGPFMLFLVLIPSVIRFWYRQLYSRKRAIADNHIIMSPLRPYDSVWFEYTATYLGNCILVFRSIDGDTITIGVTVIDTYDDSSKSIDDIIESFKCKSKCIQCDNHESISDTTDKHFKNYIGTGELGIDKIKEDRLGVYGSTLGNVLVGDNLNVKDDYHDVFGDALLRTLRTYGNVCISYERFKDGLHKVYREHTEHKLYIKGNSSVDTPKYTKAVKLFKDYIYELTLLKVKFKHVKACDSMEVDSVIIERDYEISGVDVLPNGMKVSTKGVRSSKSCALNPMDKGKVYSVRQDGINEEINNY